jgi:hypothetical protein
MPTPEWLAEQFEEHRAHLRAVAYRDGDFERLVAVLDPEIMLRADGGALAGPSRIVRGAQAVAAQASTFSRLRLSSQFVLVNGNIGLVSRRSDGRLFAVLGFTIAGGKVVEIDICSTNMLPYQHDERSDPSTSRWVCQRHSPEGHGRSASARSWRPRLGGRNRPRHSADPV